MDDELQGEYEFDYSKAKPNRFASELKKGGRLVVLDPEVASRFGDSASVNSVLQALLLTMPQKTPQDTVTTTTSATSSP